MTRLLGLYETSYKEQQFVAEILYKEIALHHQHVQGQHAEVDEIPGSQESEWDQLTVGNNDHEDKIKARGMGLDLVDSDGNLVYISDSEESGNDTDAINGNHSNIGGNDDDTSLTSSQLEAAIGHAIYGFETKIRNLWTLSFSTEGHTLDQEIDTDSA
ncbi:hypothetical protein BBP40_000469 [Aspergillus hancockii]|nr:hypothetical protein BBP40_000469 [Aspergillus hancockii]